VSIRVGTCSWADESLSALWYPTNVRSGEARLRYYAEHFDTVEVNSSFYAMPVAETAEKWAQRTPEGFVFHVKAFAAMTRHPVRPEQLPPDLRAGLTLDERGRVRPSRELRAAVFDRFLHGIQPLAEAEKLGGILLQLPPYIVRKPETCSYLEWARERLAGHEVLVEFRHRSWLEPGARAHTLDFLRSIGATYVMVDAPRTGGRNVLPTVVDRTAPDAYLRLHGRNAATWNIRGRSAAERFDYLYSEEELREWVPVLCEQAEAAETVWVMFNNNGRSVDPVTGGEIAQSPVNAAMLLELLQTAAR
jgi:uncharacterized protein YecE (DUF72 family)